MGDAVRLIVRSVLAVLVGLYVPSTPAQYELRPLPADLRTVTDEVGVLSAAEGARLTEALDEIVARTSVPIVLVITETTAPETIPDYTERLAQRWRREREMRPESSIFVIVALDERTIRVMPGQDLESVERAMARPGAFGDVVPLLAERRYFEGLMTLTARLYGLLKQQNQGS